MLLLWTSFPRIFYSLEYKSFLLYNIRLVGLRAFTSILLRWRSNSPYRMVGTFRRINQSISFDIVFRVLILRVAIFNGSFSRILFNSYRVILLIPACTGMFLASATELGRTPFDLLEGERELVRGFNVELGESLFAVLFIGEYGILLYFRSFIGLLFNVSAIILLGMLLFLRASFPRIRYDVILNMYWYSVLPISILALLNYLSLNY